MTFHVSAYTMHAEITCKNVATGLYEINKSRNISEYWRYPYISALASSICRFWNRVVLLANSELTFIFSSTFYGWHCHFLCAVINSVLCDYLCMCYVLCLFFYARKLHIKMRDYLASVMCACILLVHSFMLDKSYLSLCNLICFIQTAKAARKRTCHRHLGGWAVQNTASNPGVPDWERALQNTNTHTHTHPRTTIDVITSVTSHKYA